MLVLSRHIEVMRALVIRDLMTRFGRNHLGFLWTVIEPMLLCTGVMVIWSLIKEPYVHGIPIVTFVLTGYMPLTLWRHITNQMVRVMRDNINLLYHRPVSHVHIVLARVLLEFLSTTIALIVVYFVASAAGTVERVDDPGLTLVAWLFTGWFFGAQGLTMIALVEYWEPAEKFIQPWGYLQLPLSGVFFMVDWLPDYAQKLLLWNPSVHCFEMFRAGFLGDGVPTHYDMAYLAACSAAMTVVGASALYHMRSFMQIR